MSDAGSSKKRALAQTSIVPEDGQGAQKIAKTHPFFGKPGEKMPEGPFNWLKPFGANGSCLHGVNLDPKPSSKVAALDLDGTLIKSEFASKPVKGKPTWEWWRSSVPEKVKQLHESGYAIVIISNQGIKPAALKLWKEKIPLIGEALKEVPFRILAATARDQYRKPMPGMWHEVERIFKEEGVEIDKTSSFFVGDAAGRQYGNSRADFSSTDRKWALNVDIPFFTPEEYFLKLPPHEKVALPGFHVSSLPVLPLITPTSTPLLPNPPRQEVVLFVGYPCLGKTSFHRRYFKQADYLHINQDTLKTRDKCVKAVQEALKVGGSCVVDNTNRDASTRKYYVDICKANKVPLRCFFFTGSIELAWHNNLYRAYNLPSSVADKEPERALLPYGAFTGFRDKMEVPELQEGFSEIKKINWVFTGTDDEKRHWSMWLQIDGK